MSDLRTILLERELVCQHLSKEKRLQFIKELGFVIFKYETRAVNAQLELPIAYPKVAPKPQPTLTLEDLGL